MHRADTQDSGHARGRREIAALAERLVASIGRIRYQAGTGAAAGGPAGSKRTAFSCQPYRLAREGRATRARHICRPAQFTKYLLLRGDKTLMSRSARLVVTDRDRRGSPV